MNKLVRNKIPELMKSKGEECNYYIADNEEFGNKLIDKLENEVLELKESDNDDTFKVEIADIIEVIHSICDFKDISLEEIEKIRLDKKDIRGGFDNKIILTEK